MNPKYRPTNLHDATVRVIEECTEVAKECCKGLRFGLHDVGHVTGEANIDRIKREFEDLVGAYDDMIRFYNEAFQNTPLRDACTHVFDTSMREATRRCCLCGISKGDCYDSHKN